MTVDHPKRVILNSTCHLGSVYPVMMNRYSFLWWCAKIAFPAFSIFSPPSAINLKEMHKIALNLGRQVPFRFSSSQADIVLVDLLIVGMTISRILSVVYLPYFHLFRGILEGIARIFLLQILLMIKQTCRTIIIVAKIFPYCFTARRNVKLSSLI